MDLTVAFIYFRTLTLEHLDAEWFTLSRQSSWRGVTEVLFLDNNTDDDPRAIAEVLDRYPVPVPVRTCFEKHGQRDRTQSWSVNYCMREALTPWVLLTRADFLLEYNLVETLVGERDMRTETRPEWDGFLTTYCHQMGCDAQLSNSDVLSRHSRRDAPWRTDPSGPASLVGQEPACYFHDTNVDAGVWLTRRRLWEASGGLNERMVSWGYQQQAWQRSLLRLGTEVVNLPWYGFHHQHHAAPRDFQQAARELRFE
jgi:hypothetical protein